mgnify:CR=1 FL=1
MNMQVEKNSVVTLDYSVTDPDGELVDAGQEPLVYLHGGYDDIFPMIEEAVQGKKVGESVIVKMQPDDAFGEYDAELIQIEPRKGFPKELEVGMQFHASAPDGQMQIVTIRDLDGDDVTVDGNHPLAGQRLNFQVKIINIRDASQEEIAHGQIGRAHV